MDDFKCKVTLDIVTTGYDDTDRIIQILRDHIKNRANLGSVAVSESDFSATIIDPGKLYLRSSMVQQDFLVCSAQSYRRQINLIL